MKNNLNGNNQIFSYQNTNHQIALFVKELIGYNLIKATIARLVNILSTIRNIREMKMFLRQDHYLSTRLPYAGKKIREVYYSMVNTTFNSSQDKI